MSVRLENCPHCSARVLYTDKYCPNCTRSKIDGALKAAGVTQDSISLVSKVESPKETPALPKAIPELVVAGRLVDNDQTSSSIATPDHSTSQPTAAEDLHKQLGPMACFKCKQSEGCDSFVTVVAKCTAVSGDELRQFSEYRTLFGEETLLCPNCQRSIYIESWAALPLFLVSGGVLIFFGWGTTDLGLFLRIVGGALLLAGASIFSKCNHNFAHRRDAIELEIARMKYGESSVSANPQHGRTLPTLGEEIAFTSQGYEVLKKKSHAAHREKARAETAEKFWRKLVEWDKRHRDLYDFILVAAICGVGVLFFFYRKIPPEYASWVVLAGPVIIAVLWTLWTLFGSKRRK